MLSRTLSKVADVMAPPVCPACGAETEARQLCGSCFADARFIAGPICSGCGRPEPALAMPDPDFRCSACLRAPHAFTEARAAAVYGGTVRRMILSLKHADRQELAPLMARWLAAAAGPLLEEAEIIVPVPLHWRRRLKRGTNQAAEIARPLAAPGRAFRPDLLRRVRATPSQGGLDRGQRLANLHGAIQPARYAARVLSGRRVLVVDDVMTTGATLDTSARALIAAGASRVDALVIAVVQQTDDAHMPASTHSGQEPFPGGPQTED